VPPSDSGGRLTLVGTPIGNLGDLTAGAERALREADVICAEDTRRTRKLLTAYDVHPRRLVSVRAHNEVRSATQVRRWVDAGLRVALVTDAGMPAISDPGQRLVSQLLDAGVPVSVAPGPDAATTALSVSGLPADRWCFEGFLPATGADRSRRLAALAGERRTAVLFEAPHRLLRTLDDLSRSIGPDRPVAVLNDLTKRFERAWWGSLGEVSARLRDQQPRGEFVLVIGGSAPDELDGVEVDTADREDQE
jgi:16S rRNA (cytidine1402-2'-O)-methyltransferase